MQAIPLRAIPAQKVNVLLGRQSVDISLRQRTNGLYADISLDGKPIACGIICQDRTFILGAPYLGLLGDLCFVDAQGNSDPSSDGLGGRFTLLWIEPGDAVP